MPSTIFMFFKETFLFEVLVKHLSSPLGENEAEEDEPIIKQQTCLKICRTHSFSNKFYTVYDSQCVAGFFVQSDLGHIVSHHLWSLTFLYDLARVCLNISAICPFEKESIYVSYN